MVHTELGRHGTTGTRKRPIPRVQNRGDATSRSTDTGVVPAGGGGRGLGGSRPPPVSEGLLDGDAGFPVRCVCPPAVPPPPLLYPRRRGGRVRVRGLGLGHGVCVDLALGRCSRHPCQQMRVKMRVRGLQERGKRKQRTPSVTLAKCYPPTAVGYRPTAVGCPPTAVGYPPTAVGHPPTAVGCPPTAVGHPPTAVGCPPTAVCPLEPPLVTLQPPSDTLQPPSVTLQPPSVDLEPQSVTPSTAARPCNVSYPPTAQPPTATPSVNPPTGRRP